MRNKQRKQHSHSIEFIRFIDIPGHVHSYDTETTVNHGHRHLVRGQTTPPYQDSSRGHVHYYEGTTSFNDGHVHHFRGWTGPPIPLPGGGHYHEFSGETTFNDGHVHYYSGRTSNQHR